MSSLLLLNGSPRGAAGNSAIMLERVGEGWTASGGAAPTTLHLTRPADFTAAVDAFAGAGTIVLGMPLYTDAMPGLVMAYVEELERYVGRVGNPRIGFIVQSGFMEATHSRHLERYLEKLARRLGCAYAGTIVKGNGEAIRQMPDNMNAKLFDRCRWLGASLHACRRFDAELLRQVAGTERFGPVMRAVGPTILSLPVVQSYWTGQLKKNGAWERRFARPYA